MHKILIIEDDEGIRSGLEDDFRFEGYEVESAVTGHEGLEKGLSYPADVIILDIMLPEMSGLEVCKELRKKDVRTPIIMLTAKSQDIDIVVGLELGADDYVTKPFSPHELRARVKAQIRRSAGALSNGNESRLSAGKFTLDEKKHQCLFDDQEITLTSIEFNIMKILIRHAGELVKRDELLDSAWGEDVYVTQRNVDTHIANLRRKFGDDARNPKYIVNVRGLGYKLVD
jgi:DNA-binding response OmpR family regulator